MTRSKHLLRAVTVLIFWRSLNAGLAVAEQDYAQRCQSVIGVPVPAFNCRDPRADEIDPGPGTRTRCNTPAHGTSDCNPGTRMLRYVDTFTRNGREEKVTTMILCRKNALDNNRNTFSDIGVIQFNETKNATCWFSKVVLPGESAPLVYPPPSTGRGRAIWGTQPEEHCIRCHQNGPWLRTPFASRVTAATGKGYKRSGGSWPGALGSYVAGDGNEIPNEIPEDSNTISKRGVTCSVGMPAWNSREKPIQIKVNAEAYYVASGRTRPPTSTLVGGQRVVRESAGYCTSCHHIGATNPADTISREAAGNTNFCSSFVNDFEGTISTLRTSNPNNHSNQYWMPPDIRWPRQPMSNEDARTFYLSKYGEAIAALRWCCGNVTSPACNGRFESPRANSPQAILNENGPCGLCSRTRNANDCDDVTASGEPGRSDSSGGTHTPRR